MSFVSHVVSTEGVSIDLAKIEAVTNWPCPFIVSEVLSFLDLAGYYIRAQHMRAVFKIKQKLGKVVASFVSCRAADVLKTLNDPYLVEKRRLAKAGQAEECSISFNDGLMFERRLCMPVDNVVKTELLIETHSSSFFIHLSSEDTETEASRFVAILECARVKVGECVYGLHHRMCLGLKNYTMIWVVVDRLYSHKKTMIPRDTHGKGLEKRDTFVTVRSLPPFVPSSFLSVPPSVAAVATSGLAFLRPQLAANLLFGVFQVLLSPFSLFQDPVCHLVANCTIKPVGGGFPDAVHGVEKADEAFPTPCIASGEAFPMRDQHSVGKAYPDSLPPTFVPTPRTASGDPFPTYFSLFPTFFDVGKIPISCSVCHVYQSS
ncbi:pol protein [Cucumis melo var. makuwa]|uniref:Pol protein n=1 Tax=Cucumis melo var. makuwa TaxID=1194695 RepID=A0A5D3C8X5_CUCMM|nr:pol protein [Cucumis melo var. makuwa]TYK08343.1 pol protein [Cucumis melo var. makuwa]